jgi:hypothetical protein
MKALRIRCLVAVCQRDLKLEARGEALHACHCVR